MGNIIEVSGLKKAYGPVQAVRGIDFNVEQGKLFAFLGPNGAGKSTTIDILCTILRPPARSSSTAICWERRTPRSGKRSAWSSRTICWIPF